MKPACILRAKCQTGKTLATQCIQEGALLPRGMKIPERKSNGKMEAFTTAGEASASLTLAVMAKPRAEKLTAPTTKATMKTAQINELLLKVLCHNIVVVNNELFSCATSAKIFGYQET